MSTLNKNNLHFQEIRDQEKIVGWHAYARYEKTLSQGTAQQKEIALRIAFAEYAERALFLQICQDKRLRSDFLIDYMHSTCGFAAGFENNKARDRAICEALERWAWSKWIDEHHQVQEIRGAEKLLAKEAFNDLTKTLLRPFIEVRLFQKKFHLLIHGKLMEYLFCTLLAYTDVGVYAGSRVCHPSEDPWQHAAIEAFRNYMNVKLKLSGEKLNHSSRDNWYINRITFFGLNKASANQQIAAATKKNWPTPEMILLKKYESANDHNPSEYLTTILDLENLTHSHIYLWRCLFKDFMAWHLGPDDRFVY